MLVSRFVRPLQRDRRVAPASSLLRMIDEEAPDEGRRLDRFRWRVEEERQPVAPGPGVTAALDRIIGDRSPVAAVAIFGEPDIGHRLRLLGRGVAAVGGGPEGDGALHARIVQPAPLGPDAALFRHIAVVRAVNMDDGDGIGWRAARRDHRSGYRTDSSED